MSKIIRGPKSYKLQSGYFQTDIELLVSIANKTQSYNAVAAYLALARHGDGSDKVEPYRYSGAGYNSVINYVKVGEITAHNVVDILLENRFIHALPKSEITSQRRYMLMHQNLNLCIPWAFVADNKTASNSVVDSALNRLQKKISDEKLKLDALMLLLNCYRADYFKMTEKGGVDPYSAVSKDWECRVIPKGGNQEWRATAQTDSTYCAFMRQCLSYRIPTKQNKLTDQDKTEFWCAWGKLKEFGLLYEAVTLFDARNKAYVTLRVNDYHADKPQDQIEAVANSIVEFMPSWFIPKPGRKAMPKKDADPSYMRVLNEHTGTELQFYDYEKEEIRVTLPNCHTAKTCSIKGVYRPRFRPSTEDVGKWVEREHKCIKSMLSDIDAFNTERDI